MTSPRRRITFECPKCHEEYQDWYRPAIDVALDPAGDVPREQAGTSTCPSCGFTIRHGVMLVREEAGVWIVEAMGEGSEK
jgi:predicted RNA-binding Zn-ribbon protein involved in translation (DUF1610 family)